MFKNKQNSVENSTLKEFLTPNVDIKKIISNVEICLEQESIMSFLKISWIISKKFLFLNGLFKLIDEGKYF